MLTNKTIKVPVLFYLTTSYFAGTMSFAQNYPTDILQESAVLQEISLEDLLNIEVEVATKTSEKSSLSPAIMTVITAQDIYDFGYNTVAEAMNHVAGFVDNFDLAMHNFGVRGVNSSVRSGSRTIKFMLDGQAIAFRSTSQNFIDLELVPMGLIKRIEIIRGPASALYGANAFLAVVNVVTLKGEDLALGEGSVAISANVIESAGSGQHLDAFYGSQKTNWQYTIAGKMGSEDREGINLPRISPAYNRVENVQSGKDESKPLNFYSNVSYQWDNSSKVNVRAYYQQLNVDNTFTDINPLKSAGVTTIGLENLFLRADYEFNIFDNILSKVFAVYSHGGTLDKDRIELGAENFFFDRRFGFEALEFGGEFYIPLGGSDSLLVGADTKYEKHKIETFSRIDRLSDEKTALNLPRNETVKNTGAYFQYLKQISEHWRAIAGLRVDDDSLLGTQSSFRLGAVGQLGNDIIFKALAGSSFQAPSPELLYRTAVQAGDIIGNSDLIAQEAKTYELSISMPIDKRLHMSLTAFQTNVEELVVFESDGSNLFATNSAASKTTGIELEVRMLWRKMSGYFNYSRQKTKRDAAPNSLFVLEHRKTGEIYPEHHANLGLSYRWAKHKTTLSWNNRWVGSRKASTLNVLYINQFYELEPYLDSSLTLSSNKWSLISRKETNIQLKIKDLFDRHYVSPGFGGIDFPSLGRQIQLSVTQQF